MEGTRLDQHASWQALPLCCHYLLAHFAPQAVQVRSGDDAHCRQMTWALGTLRDGQREVLGVWHHSLEGVLCWQTVFDDLAVRGVEQIRFAVNADAAASQATFPRLTALDFDVPEHFDSMVPGGQHAPRSTEFCGARNGQRCDLSTLPRRVQQLARRGEKAVRLLQRGVTRAAARHGAFDSAQAAAAFVGSWLANAECRQQPAQFPASHRPVTAAAART